MPNGFQKTLYFLREAVDDFPINRELFVLLPHLLEYAAFVGR